MRIFTRDELPLIAREILGTATDALAQSASIIALSGDLGSGKTTLVQEIARSLGIREHIISPTFVIMKIYAIRADSYPWKKLVHIDAYRLASGEELIKLGWKEIQEDKDNLVIIEWPEHVQSSLAASALKISLSHDAEETRIITL
ncbi:MAG: tRNA (adenosine(37)-N6)-threonylcarbamoyltransferase complex ATPase subunit type 1 TsaE [Patescibacteria group bacterium]